MSHPPERPQAARRTIQRFVRTTALRRRLWFAAASIATHAVAVGVTLYLVDWAYPSANETALLVGLAWLGLVAAWHACHRGWSLPAADGTLGLQDRLRTWWGYRDQDAGPAVRWLEIDLSRSLSALPAAQRGQLWRRPARRLLWLLPLLLAVWILGPLGRQTFLPSPFGVTEPDPSGAQAKRTPERGPRKVAGGDGATPGEAPDDLPPSKPPQQPAQPPPPPGADDPPKKDPPPRPAQKRPPAPILPLPGKDEFVIPKMIGAGEGRKGTAPVAVLEESEAGGRADPTAPRGGSQAPPDPQRAQEFRRAEERALRSRYVPEAERAIVRRYFAELLRDGAPETGASKK